MKFNRWAVFLVPLLGLIAPGTVPAADKPAQVQVELKDVKYQELIDTIKRFKGKVVVVDFWADT